MKIHFKKLDSKAQKPKFGKPGDAGADLVATSREWRTSSQVVYGTGLAVEIPEGMVGLVFPRSSIRNYDLEMTNSVGVIDSGYRGEIMVTFNVNHRNKINPEVIINIVRSNPNIEELYIWVQSDHFNTVYQLINVILYKKKLSY